MSTLEALAQAGGLISVAMLVGFMAVVEWSLVPAQNRLDARGYATLEQGMNRVLTKLTPALMITALLGTSTSAALGLTSGKASAWWWAVAALGIGVMVVSTLIINAPVNAEIDRWDAADPPATWQQSRDRWERGHRLRSYVGLVVLACVAAAVIT